MEPQELTGSTLDNLDHEELKANEQPLSKSQNRHALFITRPPKKLLIDPQFPVPTVLPIQRGTHICNEVFVKKFRDSYAEDSKELANLTTRSGANAEYNV